MRRFGQVGARFGVWQGGQKFQEQGDVIGQLVRGDIQPRLLVALQQRDHRLAAIAGFAMDVLEQMQGQRPGAVKQVDITRLGLQQVGGCDILDQKRPLPPDVWRTIVAPRSARR